MGDFQLTICHCRCAYKSSYRSDNNFSLFHTDAITSLMLHQTDDPNLRLQTVSSNQLEFNLIAFKPSSIQMSS